MKVHRKVPMPPDARNVKYPFGELEVGDTVFIEDDEVFEKARRAAQAYGRQKGWKFSARKHIGIESIDGEDVTAIVSDGGTIWRIE